MLAMTQYSHDGIRDSLTQLAAPTLFYDELRRELARANRGQEAICLVRFVLQPTDPKATVDEFNSDSLYEDAILSFAQTLKRLCREEDLCARMGEMEFVSILHGAELAALRLISRISESWRADFARRRTPSDRDAILLAASSVVSRPMESSLELLDRLDSM